MVRYVIRRVLLIIPTVFLVAVVIFSCLYFVPGDPTSLLLGSNATQAQKDELRDELGLNDPYFVQLGKFLKDLFLEFDLGTSYQFKRSVASDLAERLPVTFKLVLFCFILEAIIGIPLGVT
ncbi:MAG: ABC transporter permease, partial [Bacteroides thetaiotaomicron]|nr:ABC transporter permease [Bacteroides thetaiotaomicron]